MKTETINKANELIKAIAYWNDIILAFEPKSKQYIKIQIAGYVASESGGWKESWFEFGVGKTALCDEYDNILEDAKDRLQSKIEKQIKKLEKELENLKD